MNCIEMNECEWVEVKLVTVQWFLRRVVHCYRHRCGIEKCGGLWKKVFLLCFFFLRHLLSSSCSPLIDSESFDQNERVEEWSANGSYEILTRNWRMTKCVCVCVCSQRRWRFIASAAPCYRGRKGKCLYFV